MPMTVREAIAACYDVENMQPEGKEVADAYKAGYLQSPTENLYLIAYLLHQLNTKGQ